MSAIFYTTTDLDSAARTVWGEARGEPDLGRAAVAWVIRNRYEVRYLHDMTIEAVCKHPYQFSCWLPSDPNHDKLFAVSMSDADFNECHMICARVFDGDIADPTDGARHYKVTSLPWPKAWGSEVVPCFQVGHHSFYKIP